MVRWVFMASGQSTVGSGGHPKFYFTRCALPGRFYDASGDLLRHDALRTMVHWVCYETIINLAPAALPRLTRFVRSSLFITHHEQLRSADSRVLCGSSRGSKHD